MRTPILRLAIIEALKPAGPQGLMTDELMAGVAKMLGRPIRERSMIVSAISKINRRGYATIWSAEVGISRRYWLVRVGKELVQPAAEIVPDTFQTMPELPPPASITAALMGDPLPGRSAWDRRQTTQQEVR